MTLHRRIRRFVLLTLCCVAGRAPLHAVAQNACADGDRALAASHWTEANDAYLQCVQVKPVSAVYSNMGIALSHLGRMDDAVRSYTKALQLEPENAHIEFNLAVTLLRAGEFAAAADHLKHLQRTGADPRYDELLAFCYYHLGSYPLAARAAERVYAAHPQDAANALILGSTYTRMRQYDKAMPLLTFALKAAGSAEGHLILAQTLIGLHQYPAAQTELDQIAAAEPNFQGLHEALGEVYVGTERTGDAEKELELAVKQDPNDFEANYLLGRLKRFGGDFAAANHYFDIADREHPRSPEIAYERAEIAIKERRFADAVPLLEFVTRSEPDEAQAVLLLAQAYQKTGRQADAQREGELYNAKRRESHTQRETAGSAAVGTTP